MIIIIWISCATNPCIHNIRNIVDSFLTIFSTRSRNIIIRSTRICFSCSYLREILADWNKFQTKSIVTECMFVFHTLSRHMYVTRLVYILASRFLINHKSPLTKIENSQFYLHEKKIWPLISALILIYMLFSREISKYHNNNTLPNNWNM